MADLPLSDIPSEIVRSVLLQTIEEQLQSKDFQFHVSSASKAGENNFIGVIYRVSCSRNNNSDSDENSAKNIILKVAPQNLLRRSQFVVRPAFTREIYFYEKILPALKQFELSKGLTDGFTDYPKCYRTVDIDINECLIFEDLSVRGFTTIDRRAEEVTPEHVRLVMQSLGKFHAISLALKDQQPDRFKELAASLDEVFIRDDDPHLRECFTKQAELAIDAVSGADDAHLLNKVKQFYEKEAIDIGVECLNLKLTGSASVITHGDCNQNNTMFRYDNNGKPIEVSLLDWQTVREASPIIDIVYFMFCCTTKELRDAHYNELLKIYQDSLSTHIERLGSNPEKLFPYGLMLEHFRKFGKFGLILSTVVLPMITSDSGCGLDLDGMKDDEGTDSNDFISEKSRMKLNERLRDVISDMVRLEYI